MYKVISIWSILLISILGYSQGYVLSVHQNGSIEHTKALDSLSAQLVLLKQIEKLRADGYLGASVDSLKSNPDSLKAYLSQGNLYNYLSIRGHNIAEGYLRDKETTLSLAEFDVFQDQLLSTYENSGYPFAQLVLLNTKESNDSLYCNLKFYPYLKFDYDSLVYYGNSKLSKRYISKYLDVEQGTEYAEEVVREIDKKLRNLPLVRVTAPSQIVFYRGLARIILSIDDVVTDRVDGVVGLAPNSSNSDKNTLLLTGEVNVELNNLFKSAKQLELRWRNYLQRSQKLDVGFTYPYLFNTKLGINGELNLNKYDTVFLNVKNKLSFRYQQKGNNYIQFYYQNINSNLITTDTNSVRLQKRIPSNNPYKIDNYGLAAYQRDFDYLPNPRKGYMILADVAIGQKTILKNELIKKVKFLNSETNQLISLYDTMDTRSIRLDFTLNASFFIPIKKRGTVHQKLQFNGLFSDQIFFNELYNFGGFSSLRGFDENELFASKSLNYTIEYKYLIGQNSNVGLFFNTAAIENTLQSSDLIYDIPYGFGAIANIQVGKGILNMAYALGSQQGNPLQLSSAKFHFGVVNYF
ncbi:BamA/TamA family outer membrane protein [Bacteroidia bacterium]|nr:BamA/TamA family outer membrane protein [Bacteroidia bacterium]MDB9882431.1 BamA/TamA family outer membrane protein [Bacteroidia bacterium]